MPLAHAPVPNPSQSWRRHPLVVAITLLLAGGLALGVIGCTSADDGDENTKNIGSITFDKTSSANLAAHPLKIPTTGTWSFIPSSTPADQVATAPAVREKTWNGVDPVLDVPAVRQNEPSAIGTFTFWLARSTTGAIYLVRADLSGNSYLGVGQPALYLPASIAVGTVWSTDFGGSIAQITATDATSPSGYTGCVLMRVTDSTDSTLRKRDEYWRVNDGLLELVENPGLGTEQRLRRRDVPPPPAGAG